jgi:hypothetical protein
MKRKSISLLISLFLFASVISAQTAERKTHNVGYDPITQGLYFGFNYPIHAYSIGLDIGSSLGLAMPLYVSLCLDNALYFGKPNKYNIKTWHVNARFAYSKILVNNKPNVLYIVPSVGKTFSLNEKLGLNIDLGYAFQVLDDWGEELIGEGFTSFYFGGTSIPNIRIELNF